MRSITNIKSSVHSESAFTLIELLIVVAIIGALATFVIFTFGGAQESARDANRKSDLAQYRNALETFANSSNGLYPSHATAVAANTICGAAELNLSVPCPLDPKNGTSPYGYKYLSNGSGGITATRYVLYEYLERPDNYWYMCSNGTNAVKASAPTMADCP